MNLIHVRNLEKYHPGYKDRQLKWAKIYFGLIQGDPEFELITSEIDKWRFIALVMLELEAQKPLPDDPAYWKRKGFDIQKRSMSLTLQMLQPFLEVVTDEKQNPLQNRNADKIREEREKRRLPLHGSPGIEDVKLYAAEIKLSDREAESFFDHFTSNGWKVGGHAPMKDWRAALRNWQRRLGSFHPKKGGHTIARDDSKPKRDYCSICTYRGTAKEVMNHKCPEDGRAQLEASLPPYPLKDSP